ncbi:uncharacterized protein SPAPADRAFT_150678 [Spathaspora passalidarum NRRL Y-27907]|uniref:Ubiquitin-conjugating enzyme E2C-binding protein n=1 Tax=Spathaspora passalidarum (strain NRRL Y-27907 / 11-Y1) TaxID=619300 RepID=G3AL30_SPAPN|nr:uncharacterized protein SPAPADRAFT_150678 [Spathaspora passalidarum NRRL Y-27907]EGW33072.1 hypothetical protein SPAPADRAFT_150678 [Spathaspora passalidarum NRRL Y-27907]
MYYTEYLPRLNSISVVLDVPKGFFIDVSTKIILKDPHQLSIQSSQTILDFKLPLPITKFSITNLALQNQVLSFKLVLPSIKPDDSSVSTFMNQLDQKWSCNDLKKTPKSNNNHTFQFVCANCETPLIRSEMYTFKDMPSEYWYEMMDFWHCHKPESDHDHSHDKDYKGVLVPHDDHTVIIGTYYLLQKSNSNITDNVTCAKCGCILGEMIQDNVLKILKWKISLVYADQQERFDSKLFMYNSIIDKINSSATRRFKFKLDNAWKYLWVMNLGVKATLNGDTLVNALKVAFTDKIQEKDEDSYELVDIPYSEIVGSFINDLSSMHSKLPQSINCLTMGPTNFQISLISP